MGIKPDLEREPLKRESIKIDRKIHEALKAVPETKLPLEWRCR